MDNLDKYLQDLEEQKNTEVKDIIVVKNSVLERLLKKYERWFKKTQDISYIENDYRYARRALKTVEYTADDVKKFSILLKNYETREWFNWSGLFISALINNLEETNVELMLNQLNESINFIGYKNEKNLTIIGDTKHWTGNFMKKGKIIVKGNTKDSTGEGMKGGMILVEGNVGDDLGHEMYCGKIIVNGNAEIHTGLEMNGGELHINGSIKEFHETCKGKIYQNGKLVWPADD